MPTPNVAGLLRAARAIADVSQRELAERSGLSKSAIARMERDDIGATTTVRAFSIALAACNITMAFTKDGLHLKADDDLSVDRGSRRFPPHLDPHPVWKGADWWGLRTLRGWDPKINGYTPIRSYNLSRELRDQRRGRQSTKWDLHRWHEYSNLVPPCHVSDAVAFRVSYGRSGADSQQPTYFEGPLPLQGGRIFHRFYPWDS